MKKFRAAIQRGGTVAVACGILLAACSRAATPAVGTSSQASNPFFLPIVPALGFKVLYNFTKGDDGATPFARLVDANGTFYGTTSSGGSGSACDGGCGTLFKSSATGDERVVYSFGSYPHDGYYPYAGVVQAGATFYGTTHAGGSSSECGSGCGTVFKVNANGDERLLYSFGSYKGDGTKPYAGLTQVGRLFYGTTESGGQHGHGAVFRIDAASGKERVLYSFGSYKGDGLEPAASLTYLDGMLYGTTIAGGTENQGTVFSIEASGHERVMHAFGRGKDGKNPHAGLLLVNGMFYGTTPRGGSFDQGTVFIIDPKGIEGVLHSFGKGADGSMPEAPLLDAGGKLYGTTESGGARRYGTVFSLLTVGKESVLHSFDGAEGAYPYDALTAVGGKLYGTTPYGGSGTACSFNKLTGCGTIFVLAL